MARPKLGIYWAAGCGGCDTKVLDVHEKILDIAAAADILFWPIALDTKYKDVESWPDDFSTGPSIRNHRGNRVNLRLRRCLWARIPRIRRAQIWHMSRIIR